MKKYNKIINSTEKDATNSCLVCKRVILGHRKPIVALAGDEKIFFSTSKDKTIKTWHLENEKEIFQYVLNFTPSSEGSKTIRTTKN